MGKILITGVDGNLGQRVAETILQLTAKENLIFTSPNDMALERYSEMGVEVRYANFNDSEQLVKSFSEAETLLLISMPFVGPKRRAAHKNAVDACVRAGVKRLVYTSIVGAGLEECDTYEISDHKYTEQYILNQPLRYVFLRHSQYAEAMVSAYEEAHENTGDVMSNNMGSGLMAYVSRDDCAVAAAYVAAGAGGSDAIYYINGPEAMPVSRYVEMANQATGYNVVYNEITDEQTYKYFDSIGVPRTTEEMWADSAKNFPFCSDGMVTFGRAIRLGQMSNCTDDFEKLTGKKPLSVKEVFMDLENHRIGSRTSTDT